MNNSAFHKYFKPWRNSKTLEWAIENDPEFLDQLHEVEIQQEIDSFLDILGDIIEHQKTPENKAMTWASENFYDLEFCLEFNPSWYCDNSKIGSWIKSDFHYLQKDDLFDGIFIGTIQAGGDIEHQAQDGSLAYSRIDGYFKIIARVA